MAESGGEAVRPKTTIFVSYASEDREAARSIGDSLQANGLEVWLDESELGGGDAWDQKIRRQIRECDFFMALISSQTEARHEGYFRREWRLAVERTLDMADDHAFLLPVVIDDTIEAHARVPEKFLSVQWLKLPAGRATPALENLCRRLSLGVPAAAPSVNKKSRSPLAGAAGATGAAGPTGAGHASGAPPPGSAPPPREFPRQEPGQKIKYWVEVAGWLLWSGWALFKRWPRWIRILLIIWLCIVLMNRGCSDHGRYSDDSRIRAKKPVVVIPDLPSEIASGVLGEKLNGGNKTQRDKQQADKQQSDKDQGKDAADSNDDKD